MAINEDLKNEGLENGLPSYFIILIPLIGSMFFLLIIPFAPFPTPNPIAIGHVIIPFFGLMLLTIFFSSLFVSFVLVKKISLNGWRLLNRWETKNPTYKPLYYTNNLAKMKNKKGLRSKISLAIPVLFVSLLAAMLGLNIFAFLTINQDYYGDVSLRNRILVNVVYLIMILLFPLKFMLELGSLYGMVGIYQNEKGVKLVSAFVLFPITSNNFKNKRLKHLWIKEKKSRRTKGIKETKYSLIVGHFRLTRMALANEISIEDVHQLKDTIESSLNLHGT